MADDGCSRPGMMMASDGASQGGIQPQVQRRGRRLCASRVSRNLLIIWLSRITTTARKALPVRVPIYRLPLREDEKGNYLPQPTEISPWPRGAKIFDAPSGSIDGSKGEDVPPTAVGYLALPTFDHMSHSNLNPDTYMPDLGGPDNGEADGFGLFYGTLRERAGMNIPPHTEDETAS